MDREPTNGLEGETSATAIRELLRRESEIELPMRGGSMSPWLRVGDRLRLSAATEVRLGDIVLIDHGAHWLVHRVIGRRGCEVLTRGDSVRRADPTSDRERIIAIVRSAWRGGRRLRFGLGPERLPLAVLSRLGLLAPVLGMLRRWRGKLPWSPRMR